MLRNKPIFKIYYYTIKMANSYIGMNFNLDCVCYDAWDETTIMAFKDDVVQFFTNEVLSRTDSRLAMFPEIGTNTVSSVYRSSQAGTNPNVFWQLYFYDDAGTYWRYETTSLNPTGYTFLGTGSHPWMVDVGPRGEGWQLWWKLVNGVPNVDLNGNTGQYVAYGPNTSYYPTLPNTQVPDACWHNTTTGVVYVSIIDTIYLLDTTTATVTSFAKYNQPVVPPTPLPDQQITYQAPAQFNLFASDVSLVSETQYGWKFNKTINDANKMELYLYHASAPLAPQFTYADLLQLTVNMKNNLQLPIGELFINVYTGPPTGGNWYNYKDTYNFSPALGTSIDTGLVDHIQNLTDSRTDPILAISLHSNSAQQQVNCEVERVSFTILIPSINSTQKVIVKLANNFIVADDKFWDFDQVLYGHNGTGGLMGGWSLSAFSPNIVAGNYPQTVSCTEQYGQAATGQALTDGSKGVAWYMNGTFTYYETTDGSTWTATGGTITFTDYPAAANRTGIQSDGWAYIGAEGEIHRSTTGWSASQFPYAWEVLSSGELRIIWIGQAVTNNQNLGYLPQPHNFSQNETQRGFFDAGAATGTAAVTCFVSTATSPASTITNYSRAYITVLSETAFNLQRSWELTNVTTTYNLNQADTTEVVGQYVGLLPSSAPNSYKGTKDLVVVNEPCPEQILLLFSGGLNHIIGASGAYSVSVNAAPAGVTYTWNPNYYDINNILISPVVGFTPTGSQSNFSVDFATMPANAKFILYKVETSDLLAAQISIALEPFVPFAYILTFSGGLNNTIDTSGLFAVNVHFPTAGITYAYSANFMTMTNTVISAVPNIGLGPGDQSAFTINLTNNTVPTNADYIDYICQSSDGNLQRVSLIIVRPDTAFVLLFSHGLNNVIAHDGIFSVSVDPDRTADGVTYSYTAKFYDQNNGFLGDVPGIGTSGASSVFTIVISALPLGTEYISFLCTSSEGYIAQVSLIIFVPCKPSNFRLDFSGGTNDIIEVDGTYSVFPDPIEATATYAYSARFFDIEDNDLGPVPGIGLTGNLSAFTITHATLPPLYAYILYTCAATGGDQGGGSARLSITLLQTVEPNRPPHTTVKMEQSASMAYINEDYTGSHKYVTDDHITDIELRVLGNHGETKVCQNPLDYEIEVKYVGDI